MARVVFVHGIAQHRKQPGVLRDAWAAALDDGLDAIRQSSELRRAVDAAMAFWGRLFTTPGAQGDADDDVDEWDADTREIAEELAREWLEHATDAETDQVVRTASRALAELDEPVPTGEAQGPGAVARRALDLVGRLRLSKTVALPVAASVMRGSLYQVARYVGDPNTRRQALDIVHDEITDDTQVVIGHSLGSVIAYEACVEADRELPLLVTLGSPLGQQSVIYRQLLAQPPTFPPSVGHWVNVADRDDIVASRLELAGLFPAAAGEGRLVDHVVSSGGFWTHGVASYLRAPTVCYPIDEAIRP